MIHEVTPFAQRPRKYQPLPCMMSQPIISDLKLKTFKSSIRLFSINQYTQSLVHVYMIEI